MKKSLLKTSFREIKHSIGRFISITCIIALGVGFFAGLKIMMPDMRKAAQEYLTQQNFYDYKLMCSYGYTDESVRLAENGKQVTQAQAAYSADAVFMIDDTESVFKVLSDTDKVNRVSVTAGRKPENKNECLADARYFDEKILGTTVKMSDRNDKDTFDNFTVREFKVVGIGNTPLYLNYERGTTKLGNGTIAGFLVTVQQAFDMEAYTEMYLKLDTHGQIYSDEYNDCVKSVKGDIENLSENIGKQRFDKIKADAESEYNDGYKEYSDNLKKYNDEKADALKKLDDAKEKLVSSQEELDEKIIEYEDGESKYSDGLKQFTDAENQYNDGLAKLDNGIKEAENGIKQLDNAIAPLEAAPVLDEKSKALLAQLKAQREQAVKTLEQLKAQREQIIAQGAELEKQRTTLTQTREQLDSAKSQLSDGQRKIDDGWNEYNDGKKEADEKFSDAQKKLDDAKAELLDARKEIDDLEKVECFTLGRDANTGYVCFENDSAIVDGIAAVFPIFFFLVAALMCMTTMKRMVEEQRTDIGTMKALGYSRWQILSKYILYSALAGFMGTVIGFFGFSVLFPKVIWISYGLMYNFAPIKLIFDPLMGVLLLLVSLVCTVGTTILSCMGTLNEAAAQIMRPKAPKSGKHAFFERMRWFKRLSFLRKVSIRNLTRYKQRFIMMVLGIGGCTALLITGFGIKDSIQRLPEYQFGEIMKYDFSLMLTDNADNDMRNRLNNFENLDGVMFVHSQNYDIQTDDGAHSATVVATDEPEKMKDFVCLKNKNRQLEYPNDGQAVVSRKFAESHKLEKGKSLTITDSDGKRTTLTVADICENYVDSYVYTTANSLKSGFGYAPDMKSVMANCKKDADLHKVSADLMNVDGVANVTVMADTSERIVNMLACIDYIVLLVVACAGALAFVVLYNLTNINITERIREIATIKVLGFYPAETSRYVFGENFVLTAIGAFIGLFLGKALHTFVMSKVIIDKVAFNVRVDFWSYVWSVALTFVFAVIVDIVMYRKLNKIDMAQSLKSIE